MSPKKSIAATGQHPILFAPSQHLVVCGTPASGLAFFGPFDTVESAVEWADVECEFDYWVEDLQPTDKGG